MLDQPTVTPIPYYLRFKGSGNAEFAAAYRTS